MMNLEYLQTFLAVAEKGNFTKASEFLNVSKGLITRHINILEDELGNKLFHRTTRKVTLTEAGAVLLQKAQQIRTTAREAEIAVNNVTEEVTGLLKVAAPVELANILCREIVPGFMESFPGITLQIDASASARDIEAGEYDIALRAIDKLPDNVIGKQIGYIRNVLVAAPNFNVITPGDPDQLLSCSYIGNSANPKWNTLELTSQNALSRHLEFSGSLFANSYQAILELVQQNLGFASLPHYQVREKIKKGELRHILSDWSVRTHKLTLIFARQTVTPKKIKVFTQAFMEWVEENRSTFFIEPR